MDGIPGGYYIGTDGKPHDAWGNVIEEQPVAQAVGEGLFPDDFPGKEILVESGLTTIDSVRAVSDETLLSLKGIDPETLAKIREATNG